MAYGNCMIGAIYLKLRHGGKIRRIRTKEGGPRHWICKLNSGEVWHFKREKDILPGFLRYLIFKGNFRCLDGGRRLDQCP